MAQELSYEELEEMVVGKKINPNAYFFEQAVINLEESKRQGRRVYDTKIYIKLSQAGMSDSMSYEAQAADFRQYKTEYQYFLANRQGTQAPDISIIPNLQIAHLQELRDYGILTIPKLAELESVPPHLEYAHRAARIFNLALLEAKNGTQESKTEPVAASRREDCNPVRDVYEADRQEHGNDVGQRGLPASDIGESGSDSKGNEEDRQTQHREDFLNKGWDNWRMQFIVTG
jgi:hypothetical protein